LAILAGRRSFIFEHPEILRAKDLSTLQSQERDFMTCLLQATDRMIDVKLRGMRLIEADVAFLI
jgi:hypothetical protein